MIEKITEIFESSIIKGVISNPKSDAPYRRIQFRLIDGRYQIESFTEKQAFHQYCEKGKMAEKLCEMMEGGYKQLDAWSADAHFSLKVSKKGKITLLKQKSASKVENESHNREKQYILKEHTDIPPLVDLGVFTKDGKVVNSMYSKFRQINRFTELIRDGMDNLNQDKVRILDFGCGKSYLTFILYHYLTVVRKMDAFITGLDLKADVIEKCNMLAEKYNYKNLDFKVGDVNGYKCEEMPDMVISLHACDTATDYSLYNAIKWGCKLIYSVPCCQHELNSQIKSENLSLLTRYGLIQERFSALATDAIRGALLEACGYKVQTTEFVDMEHSPKNLLIRGVKKNLPADKRKEALAEAERLMAEFSFEPTLYKLLKKDGLI